MVTPKPPRPKWDGVAFASLDAEGGGGIGLVGLGAAGAAPLGLGLLGLGLILGLPRGATLGLPGAAQLSGDFVGVVHLEHVAGGHGARLAVVLTVKATGVDGDHQLVPVARVGGTVHTARHDLVAVLGDQPGFGSLDGGIGFGGGGIGHGLSSSGLAAVVVAELPYRCSDCLWQDRTDD